jgi:acetyl esterase
MMDQGGNDDPSSTTISSEEFVVQARAASAFVAGMLEEVPQLHSVQDLEFQSSGIALTMRLYRPSEGVLPVMLFFYGGGFISGTLNTYDSVLRTIAHRIGWAIAAPEYRLAPEHPYPAAPEDCYAALVHLASRGSTFGLDVKRIVTAGESTGGTLAAAVALMARDRRGPALAGMVCLEPGCDIPSLADARCWGTYPSLVENDGMILALEDLARSSSGLTVREGGFGSARE